MGFGRDITERKRYQVRLNAPAATKRRLFPPSVTNAYTAEWYRRPEPHSAGYRTHAEQEKYLKTIHVSAVTLGNTSTILSTWIRWNGVRSSLIIAG